MPNSGNRFKSVLTIVAPLLVLAIGLACAKPVCAGGPENVIVVVNAASQASKTIANHYVKLRGIPGSNVIYLNNVPPREQIKASAFRSRILKPIFDTIQERKLGRQIDYIVYSADFPTAIVLKDEVANAKVKPPGLNSKVYNKVASINALTYFSGMVLNKHIHYMRLNANLYMRGNASILLKSPFIRKDQEDYENAIASFENEQFNEALEQFKELAAKHRVQVALRYQIARCYAKLEQEDNCARALDVARQLGWSYRNYTLKDKAFSPVAESRSFQAAVKLIPDKPFSFLPTHSFRSAYSWGPNGMRNSGLEQGQRYVLSTVLAVTRNRGTSLEDAISQIQASVGADETMPRGTFYFTHTGDVRSKTRRNSFSATIAELESIGHRGEVVHGPYPQNKKDVLGATLGKASVRWTATKSRFVPGAICDNLTSYGGIMRNDSSQTPCTDFIAAGAAGASGTVIEPFAIQAKFPHPRLHYHYAKGCTLAEAFYQSVAGPFQLLIVGDALCQPFIEKPKVKVSGIQANGNISGNAKLEMEILDGSPSVQGIEIYVNGVLTGVAPINKPIAFDTNKLADGFNEIRLVAVHGTVIQSKRSIAIPFNVQNDSKSIKLTIQQSGKSTIKRGESVKLAFENDFGGEVEILQNSRVVGRSKKKSGVVNVSTKVLGSGPVNLFARVRQEESIHKSLPVQFKISD